MCFEARLSHDVFGGRHGQGLIFRWTIQVAPILVCMAMLGCKPTPASQGKGKTAAAKVAVPAQEAKLNSIELTPEAEGRLGIKTAKAEMQNVPSTRTLAGEVTLPLGASVIVSAPVSGTLKIPAGGNVPKVGAAVKAKQAVFLLLPLLSPDARLALVTAQAAADGEVKRAKAQLEAAEVTFKLAQQAKKDGVTTLQQVNDAKERVTVAEEALDAAKAVKALRDKTALGEAGDMSDALVIDSPQAGVMRSLLATVGQIVPSGAPLFEVMDYHKVWIRVPVYVGELNDVSSQQPAQISSLSDKPGAKMLAARPVAAPPTATPLSSTADLYYELENNAGTLRPGEKVSATLVLRGERERLTVPWSAIVHDIYGGNWVYEKTAPQTYVRRRVEVRSVVQQNAVLGMGPAPGTDVAIEGVAELYGTEFGFGK